MKHLIVSLFVICGFTIQAQVDFKAEISKDAVMIGEPFAVEYKVNQTFDNFTLPEFENFKLISGPNTSMQQSINTVNGKITKTILVIYTYYFKAVNPGTHTIQPAEIIIDGKNIYSNTIDVIVIDSEYHDPNQHKGKDIKGTQKL
ncbi:MAG: BatD family protein [Bacteroidales bacterium]|nr:BatD family protein [Bacteroidales bacterium]